MSWKEGLKKLVDAWRRRLRDKDSRLPPICLKLTGAGMCVSIVVPTHVLDTCAMRSCQNARDGNPEMTTCIS